MKKILIINDHLNPKGGADKVALWQVEQLRLRQGEENVRFFSIDDMDSGEYAFEVRNIFRNLFNIKVYWRLRAIVKEFNPHQVIVHSWTKQVSPAVFLAVRSKAVAIICHDYFLCCPNGGQYNYQKNAICGLKGGGVKCILTQCDKKNYGHKIFRIFRFWIQSILVRLCDPRLYTLNDIQYDLLADFPDKRSYKNAIDALDISNTVGEWFVFVGRPDPEKGICDLRDLKRRQDFRLVLYGPSPHEVPAELSSYAKGWVDATTLASKSSSFRACIFPSLWFEADPLVPWEMMSRGVPVVARSQNIFGQWLKQSCPDLVYDNVSELGAIVERFSDDGYVRQVSKKVVALAKAERKLRLLGIEGFFDEVIN